MSESRYFRIRKLPGKTTSIVFAFYMSAIMAFLLCAIITAVNTGMNDHYLFAVISAYKIAMPAAFVCVMIVKPIVMRLVAKTVAI